MDYAILKRNGDLLTFDSAPKEVIIYANQQDAIDDLRGMAEKVIEVNKTREGYDYKDSYMLYHYRSLTGKFQRTKM